MNLSKKRFLLVDALRGIAAMSVVIFHLVEGHHVDLFLAKSPIWLVVMLEHGNLGVSIFFVLSGFVIAHSLYDKDVTLRLAGRFMVRRSLRLDPPYWTAIVLTIAFGLVSARFVAGKAPAVITAPQMVAHVFYLQDILGYASISTVFWTLCLEVQFYFIYVFLLLAGGQYRGIVLMSAAIISFAWPAGLVSDNVWPGLFLPLWHCFLLGSVVYWAWRKPSLLPFCVLFITVIALSAAYCGNWFSLVCAATASILLLSAITNQIFVIMRWRWLQFLGLLSYSLYLSHNFVTGASFRVGYLLTRETIATEIMWSVITIAVSIAAAYSMWRWVELPSIALSHLVRLSDEPDRVLVKEART
jgi:peptidoglycan/LPS O-acetylase OafA/YrhL